ncbi:histidine phosphatase family protein [Nocardioides sp. zg-1228]|uniref:histidine phosphatase family protein n=1 Tax=Nocardioides sp. zg-1228 TaxID=2763008 RepID=UPI0016425EBC|nr:histidine phosphatase family protein [Nocardioides sp. zg-1228]MBC2934018.1 histidine phosphatase family protein [Nocardioides sp. zg-1228]QSF58774.1 histidine phosphatase family protein [Nocardioides sp. zg-1228]
MSSILLVRHGQASFGAADYDELSRTGHEQSRLLGAALAARGVVPDLVVTGGMRRHAQTAAGVLDGAGWSTPADVDRGWSEFDHLQVLAVHDQPTTAGGESEKAAFQRWFEEATRRWTSGDHDESYDESFAAFTARVGAALDRLADALPRSGTAVVLTSGGPVAWAAASLLADGEPTRTDLWLRLNPVSINTGTSTVVRGSRGTTLVTFNAADHLSPDLITYR